MTIENIDAMESELEDKLGEYIDLLLQRVTSSVKRAYAKQLLLNDFNSTLPRGIYMDNELIVDAEAATKE